jgi:hypothetical protein
MIDDYLDEDGDLAVGPDQELMSIDGADEVAQSAYLTLGSHIESYWLDQAFGTDILGQILTKPLNKGRREREIRRAALTVNELTNVRDVKIEANEATAQLEGDLSITTIYGETGVSV